MDSWFEVALAAAIFAVDNILFGHFEERTPKWRRVMKVMGGPPNPGSAPTSFVGGRFRPTGNEISFARRPT